MKIKRIEIGAFGKFKNFSLDFKDGFNLIYGGNEDGKSTIAAFCALMLYGNAKIAGKSDASRNLRKKYLPWSGEKMSGDMEFECGGKTYRVHKEFRATSKSDKITLTDTQTGEKIALAPGTEIGKYFLGLDYTGFEKSVFGFSADSFAGEENGDIAIKLANITDSGDENISPKIALSRLEKAKEALISKRGNRGRLVEVTEEKTALSNEIAAQKRREEEKGALKREYEELREELKTLREKSEKARLAAKTQEKRQRAKQLLRLAEMITDAKSKRRALNENTAAVTQEDLKKYTLLSDKKKDAEAKAEKACKLEADAQRKAFSFFAVTVSIELISFALGIVFGIFYAPMLLIALLGAALSVFSLVWRKKSKTRGDLSLDAVLKSEELDKEISAFLSERGCSSYEELNSACLENIAALEELKILEKNIASFAQTYEISEDNPDALLNLAQDIEKNLPSTVEKLNGEEIEMAIHEKSERMLEIKGRLGEDAADIASLEKRFAALCEREDEMNEYYRALSIAAEVMAEAADEMSRSFAPRLKERASALFLKLTKGKYSSLLVSKTYEIEVKEADGTAYRPWQNLSRGACAQGYLALRLALCEMLSEESENAFLMLDDILADYDEERTAEALEFLKEYSQSRQVLFFTCHRYNTDIEPITLK